MQSFDYDDDKIELIFSDEPGYVYNIPVLPSLIYVACGPNNVLSFL